MKQTITIDITDSEWEIMRILWSQKQSTSSEIITILETKKDWRPTTIKTLIARLVKKGMVNAEQEGNRYIYRPCITESDSWEQASLSLFVHVCAQKMGTKIARMIEISTLSHDDIALIESVLSKKKLTAVDRVLCNCIPGQCSCEQGTCEATHHKKN